MIEWLFAIAVLVIFYTFVGYPWVLSVVVFFKRLFRRRQTERSNPDVWPNVCLFVTAYNEAKYVHAKVQNSLGLDYPQDKLTILWVTDGSTDGTPDLVKKYPGVQVEHVSERRGKVHAMNRGMQFVKDPIVVFTDCNTLLSPNALKDLVRHFSDEKIACVAGEKRVLNADGENVAAAGESLYWNLESKVKQMESELSSVVGAAGELFAVRRELFPPVEADCLLDDFLISMRLVINGYRVVYEPAAVAWEKGSLNVREELKRKSRIAAGGIQAMIRLPQLLNPFHVGWISFQYLSHKVLRWTIAPWALLVALVSNVLLVSTGSSSIYQIVLVVQSLWYVAAFLGFLMERRAKRNKLLVIPYYFSAINFATVQGLVRFLKGKQQVAWEKAQRA